MNPHNELLHKGCAAPTRPVILIAGAGITIALCVLGAIAFCSVS